jgi:hypothetical protein
VRGDNPLCVYHFAGIGFYLYASTENILRNTINWLGLGKYAYKEIPVSVGDILLIDNAGNISKERFESIDYYTAHSGHCQYSMYYESYVEPTEKQHLAMLKQMSGLYGYTPDEIDRLAAEGWTLEDIEMILYGDIYEDEICCERTVKIK